MPRLRTALAAIAAAPLVLGACSSPRSVMRHHDRLPPAARARFEPPQGELVFRNAIRAAARAGYRIATCDPDWRRIETKPIEFDAPCGSTTCLARQSIKVKLGYRQARVTVERELYDGAMRRWHPEDDSGREKAAREIVDQIVSDGPPSRATPDPCALADTEGGARLATAAGRD